jgi:ankyrin repeat protein
MMDRIETEKFWRRAHLEDRAHELTPTEEAFVAAAMSYGRSRWDGECDVERMKELLEQEPALLETVGQAIVNITVAVRGCAPALELLLDRGLRFSVEPWRSRPGKEGEYDNVHEAAWAGAGDNLRVLLERGMADAKSLSNPHTGWPDNVSLLYWVAASGDGQGEDSAGLAQLLLDHGADPEVRFKGNGERGNTALQEAVAPGWNDKVTQSKLSTAKTLIENGACYDVFSASGLDDVDRLKVLARESPGITNATGEADTTPLHWAARAGATKCARWLLSHGAVVDAETLSGRTPLHMATDEDHTDMIWLLAGRGADLNAADSKGRTPLHRATYGGKLEAAEVLIVLGANVRKPNRSGRTPLEVAQKDCLFLKRA